MVAPEMEPLFLMSAKAHAVRFPTADVTLKEKPNS
jgi:hypothetical protein